ncbi:MAG: LysM peptidoglycan-binding domain-containing protein [Planctomycetota bacterium]|nr:LysM peptidoglycan-binding domain-containing protein [Planctomycetota bacterium]
MARETKIGLVVVFSLAVVFCTVLVRRIQGVGEEPTATAAANPAGIAELNKSQKQFAAPGLEAETPAPAEDDEASKTDTPNRSSGQSIYQVAQINAVEAVEQQPSKSASPPRRIRLITESNEPAQNQTAQTAQQSPNHLEPLQQLPQPRSGNPTATGIADNSAATQQSVQQQPVHDQPAQLPNQSLTAPPIQTQPAAGRYYQTRQDTLQIEQRPTIPTVQNSQPFRVKATPAIGISHHAGGTYIVKPNDNFWTISQAVYGTGDFFKALIRHNDARHPRSDRIAVGDEILVPTESELRSKYPQLCPRPRKRGYANITASAAARGGRTYEVRKGDTLFDIARYELGQASRWIDIYKLNQHLLTDDFNFIKPGMKLILPERQAPANVQQERFTQQQELVPLR